jgi:hypothetical protein
MFDGLFDNKIPGNKATYLDGLLKAKEVLNDTD